MLKTNRFSFLTLYPRDFTEKQLFWAFKLKSIRRSIRFYIVSVSVVTFFTLLRLLISRTQVDFIGLIGSIVYLAFFLFILWASKRTDKFVYAFPIIRIVMNAFLMASLQEDDLKDGASDFKVIYQFISEEVYIDFALLYDIILLSPS